MVDALESENKKPDFTLRKVGDWLDEQTVEESAQLTLTLLMVLTQSIPKKRPSRADKPGGTNASLHIDWITVIEFAQAKIGLSPAVFWGMTWAEYYHACGQYWHKIERAYQQSRFIAFWVAAPLSDGEIDSPADLIELSFDSEGVDEEAVEQESQEFKKKMAEFHERQKKTKEKNTSSPSASITGQPVFPTH